MMKMKSGAKEAFVEFDSKWLAGFFDGEGSVGIYARNFNKDKTKCYYLTVVSLAQSGSLGKAILDECKQRWGGSVYQNKSDKVQTLNKIMWKWNISADKAVPFLEHILPHSVIKSEQIKLCLQFQTLPNKQKENQVAAKLAEQVKDLKH